MEVKFDLVRIGKIRKNCLSEMFIKQNVDFLKSNIRSLLIDKNIDSKNNVISMVMIIPGKGDRIKVSLQGIKDENIKKELRHSIPNSIYNGEYSIIMDNSNNKTFDIY